MYNMMKYNTKCNTRQPRLVPHPLSFNDQECRKALLPVAKEKVRIIVHNNMLGENSGERTILNISRNGCPVRPVSPPTTKGTSTYVNKKTKSGKINREKQILADKAKAWEINRQNKILANKTKT